MPWVPILEGLDAVRAREAVADLAEALRAPPRPRFLNGIATSERSPLVVPMPSDAAGLALFYANVGESFGDEDAFDEAVRRLQQAAEVPPKVIHRPALHGGVAGTAWAFSHLEGRAFATSEETSELHGAFDRLLLGALSRPGAGANYDVISGLVGIGVTALERPGCDTCREIAGRVIDLLDASREEGRDGTSWFTPPDRIPPTQDAPRGYYNLGVAHGIPGIVGFLACAHVAGQRSETCERLALGALRWIERRLPMTERGPRLGNWMEPDAAARPPVLRPAWCYGDLGASAVFWLAGRVFGQHEVCLQAEAMALRTTEVDPDAVDMLDATLCHGAAGAGHLYGRIFQYTGNSRFREAARCWFGRALRMRVHADGIAGYKVCGSAALGEPEWVIDAGLLSGATGIGLAFLSAITPFEPEWDRSLLISL